MSGVVFTDRIKISNDQGQDVTIILNPETGFNELSISLQGHVCAGNSTTTNLGNGEVFTGTWQDTLDFGTVSIGIVSDQASATDGLDVQWSADGVTETQDDIFTISANKGKTFTFGPANRYVRIVYTNGTTPQGSFNLQTILRRTFIKPSSHRIGDTIVAEDDATLNKSILTGSDPNGVFRNVKTTVDGNLAISDNSDGLAIAKGDVTGTTFIHKFGNAPDFDETDGAITVWDGAEDGTTWENMVYVYSASADIDSISSSNGADTQDIEIQGLDTNWDLVIQTITLSGQSRVALDTSLRRVFRASNSNSTNLAGHVFVYVNGAITGGVPNTNNDIRVIVDPINQVTEMAVYTIPNGKTGYLRDWYGSIAGVNKNSNYKIRLKSRNDGGVFLVKHTLSLSDNATSAYQHKYEEPEVFAAKTDIEMTTEALATGVTAASVSAGFDIVLIDD